MKAFNIEAPKTRTKRVNAVKEAISDSCNHEITGRQLSGQFFAKLERTSSSTSSTATGSVLTSSSRRTKQRSCTPPSSSRRTLRDSSCTNPTHSKPKASSKKEVSKSHPSTQHDVLSHINGVGEGSRISRSASGGGIIRLGRYLRGPPSRSPERRLSRSTSHDQSQEETPRCGESKPRVTFTRSFYGFSLPGIFQGKDGSFVKGNKKEEGSPSIGGSFNQSLIDRGQGLPPVLGAPAAAASNKNNQNVKKKRFKTPCKTESYRVSDSPRRKERQSKKLSKDEDTLTLLRYLETTAAQTDWELDTPTVHSGEGEGKESRKLSVVAVEAASKKAAHNSSKASKLKKKKHSKPRKTKSEQILTSSHYPKGCVSTSEESHSGNHELFTNPWLQNKLEHHLPPQSEEKTADKQQIPTGSRRNVLKRRTKSEQHSRTVTGSSQFRLSSAKSLAEEDEFLTNPRLESKSADDSPLRGNDYFRFNHNDESSFLQKRFPGKSRSFGMCIRRNIPFLAEIPKTSTHTPRLKQQNIKSEQLSPRIETPTSSSEDELASTRSKFAFRFSIPGRRRSSGSLAPTGTPLLKRTPAERAPGDDSRVPSRKLPLTTQSEHWPQPSRERSGSFDLPSKKKYLSESMKIDLPIACKKSQNVEQFDSSRESKSFWRRSIQKSFGFFKARIPVREGNVSSESKTTGGTTIESRPHEIEKLESGLPSSEFLARTSSNKDKTKKKSKAKKPKQTKSKAKKSKAKKSKTSKKRKSKKSGEEKSRKEKPTPSRRKKKALKSTCTNHVKAPKLGKDRQKETTSTNVQSLVAQHEKGGHESTAPNKGPEGIVVVRPEAKTRDTSTAEIGRATSLRRKKEGLKASCTNQEAKPELDTGRGDKLPSSMPHIETAIDQDGKAGQELEVSVNRSQEDAAVDTEAKTNECTCLVSNKTKSSTEEPSTPTQSLTSDEDSDNSEVSEDIIAEIDEIWRELKQVSSRRSLNDEDKASITTEGVDPPITLKTLSRVRLCPSIDESMLTLNSSETSDSESDDFSDDEEDEATTRTEVEPIIPITLRRARRCPSLDKSVLTLSSSQIPDLDTYATESDTSVSDASESDDSASDASESDDSEWFKEEPPILQSSADDKCQSGRCLRSVSTLSPWDDDDWSNSDNEEATHELQKVGEYSSLFAFSPCVDNYNSNDASQEMWNELVERKERHGSQEDQRNKKAPRVHADPFDWRET